MKDASIPLSVRAVDRLVLSVHESTRHFAGRDACFLAERMRIAAVAAAGGIVRSCSPTRPRRFVAQLAEVRGVLRELGYYVDLAERLGYFGPADALELLELQAGASLEVGALIQALLGEEHAPAGPVTTSLEVPADVEEHVCRAG